MVKLKLTKEQLQKILAAALGAGLFIFVYWRYFLSPTLEHIKTTRVKIEELSRRLAELQARAARRDQLVIDLAEAEKNWEILKAKIPQERQLPQILATINRMAQKYRMELSRLAPQGPTEADLYYELPFNITVSGSYHDLALFLVEMGSLERIYHARDLSLSPQGSTEKNPATSIGATLTLVTFQYRGG